MIKLFCKINFFSFRNVDLIQECDDFEEDVILMMDEVHVEMQGNYVSHKCYDTEFLFCILEIRKFEKKLRLLLSLHHTKIEYFITVLLSHLSVTS